MTAWPRCCRRVRSGTAARGATQAWIDPVRNVAHVLMVQRTNLPNSDSSAVRRRFQEAAAAALSPARRAP